MSTYGLRRRNSFEGGGGDFLTSNSMTSKLRKHVVASSGDDNNKMPICHDNMDKDKAKGQNKENGSKDHQDKNKNTDVRGNNIELDILSLEGESLRGSSFDDDEEDVVITSGVTASQETTTKKTKRSTKDDNNSLPDLDGVSLFSMRTRSQAAKVVEQIQERKAISAQLTLRFEGMTTVQRNEVGEVRMPTRRYVIEGGKVCAPRTRMIKVSQQLSRGASSFLVFAGDVFPGTEFRFPVYRRNNYHPFSLSIFVDNVRDVRISTCCENKHQPGTQLGHFRLVSVKSTRSDPSSPSKPFICEVCIKGIPWNEWNRRSKGGKRIKFLDPLASPLEQTSTPQTRDHQERIPSPSSSSSSTASEVPSEMDYKEELDEYNKKKSEDAETIEQQDAVTEMEVPSSTSGEMVLDKKTFSKEMTSKIEYGSKKHLQEKNERDEHLFASKKETALEKKEGGSFIDFEKNEMRVVGLQLENASQSIEPDLREDVEEVSEEVSEEVEQVLEEEEEEGSSSRDHKDPNQVSTPKLEEGDVTSPSSFLDSSDQVKGVEEEEDVTEIEGEVISSEIEGGDGKGPASSEGNHEGKLFDEESKTSTTKRSNKTEAETKFEFSSDEGDLVLF